MRPHRHLWLSVLFAALIPASVFAAPLTTTNYRLDPDVSGTFGGQGSTTNYGLIDSGGAAALGFGSSPNYKLGGGFVAQLEQSLQIAVLPSGITAYYPLDTGLGVQAYDSGPSTRDGVLQNSPTWMAGQVGGSLSFNGSSQYISTSAQSTNPTAFTLELWFKSVASQGGRLIGFGDAITGASTNADRHIYMTDAGNLVFGVNPGTKKTITTAGTYNDNAWHHAAATLGAGGMQLYVDGVSAGSDPNTSAGNYAGYWRIAYDALAGWPSAPTSNYYPGRIDEVKIFNRALSANEIAGEYQAGQAAIVSAQTIPAVSTGGSQTALTDIVVRTDAPGYDLALNQDHALLHTDTVTTIPAISPGTIASPMAWSEGATTGLGFSLTAGSQIEAGWGSNPNYKYAAVPGAATTFHSRTGLLGGAPETNTIQFRLDVPSSQKSGAYANTVTITATVIP